MRQIIADATLALFASIGIWTVLILTLDRLISGANARSSVLVFFIKDQSEGMAQRVRWSLRHSRTKGILLVDCGMDDETRCFAETLAAQECRVWLITGKEFEDWMDKTELWMK